MQLLQSKPFNKASNVIHQLYGISLLCLVLFGSCSKKEKPLFSPMASSRTNIHFKNTVVAHDSLNFLDYLYFYNGGGVAVGDVNNDGLPDIYFTANSNGHNKLYLNKGNFQFEDITAKAGVEGNADWCSGVTMADVNGDGLLDIYVCAVSGKHGLKGHNQLYINNGIASSSSGKGRGEVTFTERSKDYGLDFINYSTQAVFFDYDHDGDLDCYLLNQSFHSVENYGDTSLRRKVNPFAGDKLLRNDCNTPAKRFVDVTAQSGIYSSALGYGLGIAVADVNNDGWEDIYIGNDFHENDYYYVNNGNGTFTESGAKVFNHYSRFSMGNDIADYNNDGQLDVFTVDMLPADESILKTYGGDESLDIYNYKILHNGYQNQYSRNCLQENRGNGNFFSEVGLMAGVASTDWSWCPLLADFDNDGIKDLFISNGIVKRPTNLDYIKFVSSGMVHAAMSKSNVLDEEALAKMPEGKVHNYIFKGNADEHFNDKSVAWGMDKPTFTNGATYADLNNDGKLDLVVNNIDDEAGIYQNNSNSNNYLSISFKGNNSNTFGIGCKAYLFHKGKIQYQQLMLTRGFQSSTEPRLHFGLDTLSKVDSVVIVWPDQTYQLLKNIKANQQLKVAAINASGRFNYNLFFHPVKSFFTNITDSIQLKWKHEENTFFDFNSQFFIPHEISTAGPKITVADVNGDGLDDFYACGAKNQPGSLFIQNKDGHFVASDTALFRQDAASEDVDAIFFDANKDGYPDLYVASGGNEWSGNAPTLLDRLYLNDGKGHFTKSTDALPQIYQNKSVICAADIDHDGDMDLFVGVRADATAYGIAQTSYLLLNDGKGHFSIASEKTAALKNIGMVTAASFADINKDGWSDLIIAGEWMPVTILLNKEGKFKKMDQNLPEGLWQCLQVADIDGDGNLDVLAGNYGLNSKLHATENAPLKLHVKDFDENNNIDQLLTYTVNKKEYTFLGKEELEKKLPFIKKNFLRYDLFAGKTVQEVFGDKLNDAILLQCKTLSSGVFKNDGNGNFTFQPLPDALQMAPLFAFYVDDINKDGAKDILGGGNFYGVLPYEGRYDAMPLTLALGNKKTTGFTQLSSFPQNVNDIKGEVRDIQPIRLANNKKALIIAVNNSQLYFLAL